MKIAGITRVRNEEAIIKDTLDHFGKICNAGIYVYDDVSTDKTVEICRTHPAVRDVIIGEVWNPNRFDAEWQTRQAALARAQQDSPDWLIYFDADERIEFDFNRLSDPEFADVDAIWMRLFDFYITAEDAHLPYSERKWMGCEYRRIVMAFKNSPYLRYHIPDQRIVTLPPNARTIDAGYVKHYGKAISIEEWEATCDYYANHFPEPYRTKWLNRKGKAIHTDKSDFGLPLIQWHEKDTKGVELNRAIEQNNI